MHYAPNTCNVHISPAVTAHDSHVFFLLHQHTHCLVQDSASSVPAHYNPELLTQLFASHAHALRRRVISKKAKMDRKGHGVIQKPDGSHVIFKSAWIRISCLASSKPVSWIPDAIASSRIYLSRMQHDSVSVRQRPASPVRIYLLIERGMCAKVSPMANASYHTMSGPKYLPSLAQRSSHLSLQRRRSRHSKPVHGIAAGHEKLAEKVRWRSSSGLEYWKHAVHTGKGHKRLVCQEEYEEFEILVQLLPVILTVSDEVIRLYIKDT